MLYILHSESFEKESRKAIIRFPVSVFVFVDFLQFNKSTKV